MTAGRSVAPAGRSVAPAPAPRRFLFVLVEGGGTVPPELGLARQLVARGHTVRVLADDSMAEDARAAGCAFIPYVRAPNRPDRRPETAIVKDWEIRNPLEYMLVARAFLFGTARAYAEDVLAALEREPADALVIEWALLGAIAAAEKVSRPTALLMPNCYMLPAPGLPAFGPSASRADAGGPRAGRARWRAPHVVLRHRRAAAQRDAGAAGTPAAGASLRAA